MDWKSPEINGATVKIPERWLHLHYYEALNILFRTENALRVFVYIVLKNNFGTKWADIEIQISDAQKSTISGVASQRIAQAQGFGYLGYLISSPLMHLNSGELTRLITSDTYWNLFKPYFKGKKELIRIKLDEVSVVRNALAHFRPIREEDIELVKQNVRHALLGVEACLKEIFSIGSVVPTNTQADWYLGLKKMNAPGIIIKAFQSENEQWVRINLVFGSEVLSKEMYGANYAVFKVLRTNTPAFAERYANLRNRVIYVTENAYPSVKKETTELNATKTASLVFNAETLVKNWKEIEEDLLSLLGKITEEKDQLKQDHLARGIFVETVTVSVSRADEKSSWENRGSEMRCPVKNESQTEYWGNFSVFGSDFIAGSNEYPWMPSDISKMDWF